MQKDFEKTALEEGELFSTKHSINSVLVIFNIKKAADKSFLEGLKVKEYILLALIESEKGEDDICHRKKVIDLYDRLVHVDCVKKPEITLIQTSWVSK